ncbi:hypothetical protein ANN_22912 [Periplaneta americana]|uniref:Uncharacterized protein n=1 Tax=Periplaneta americana TaxID=6978 RepID=A0ABQ8SJM2_PERAM|nr:hypothetical protein ANN_22912 [Periplaneta americana]
MAPTNSRLDNTGQEPVEAHRRYQTNDELKDAVTAAFADITPQQLRKMSQRTWRRIQLCIHNDGAHTYPLD